MKTSISVVIPNYNGVNLLSQNLPYVYKALKSSSIDDFEVIVADDASQDESVSFLQKNFPDVIVVQNKENKGFSTNVNTGIFKAQKDLVFVMNTDIKLQEGYFLPLLPYFEYPDTFAVMGKIVAWDDDTLHDAAKYPDVALWNIKGTKNYYIEGESKGVYSFFASGANALIDRKKLIELGGFNELFSPYYREDLDLGITAWRAGYKVYYEPNAVCRHMVSHTIKKQPSKKVSIIIRRNKFILCYLHFEGIDLWVYFLKLAIHLFLKCLVVDRTFVQSFALFVRSFERIKQVKKSFRQHRKKSLKEIVVFIKGSLKGKKVYFF